MGRQASLKPCLLRGTRPTPGKVGAVIGHQTKLLGKGVGKNAWGGVGKKLGSPVQAMPSFGVNQVPPPHRVSTRGNQQQVLGSKNQTRTQTSPTSKAKEGWGGECCQAWVWAMGWGPWEALKAGVIGSWGTWVCWN